MKSRLAILGMLITGLFLSTAGVGLALSGGPAQNNASVSQYGTVTPQCTATPTGGSTSPSNTGGTTQPAQAPCEEGGVLPAEAESTPTPKPKASPTETEEGGVLPAEEAETQPERQAAAAAQTSQLPFTGFAAIPVLLGGLILLTGGLVLRSRTRNNS